jgi:hypothetical protein
LVEIVLALEPTGRFANLLDGRKQQTNKHRDDGNDNQQLDQCETPTKK